MKNILNNITKWFSKTADTKDGVTPDGSKKEGFVQFFNRSKGYGFIQSKQTSKKVFVHISELKDKVRRGDRVQFQLDYNDKGLIAREVELANA